MIVRSLSYAKIWCQAYSLRSCFTTGHFLSSVTWVCSFRVLIPMSWHPILRLDSKFSHLLLIHNIKILHLSPTVSFSGPDIQFFKSSSYVFSMAPISMLICFPGTSIQVLKFRSCYSGVLKFRSWYLGPDIQVLVFRLDIQGSWSSCPDIQGPWNLGPVIQVLLFRSWYSDPATFRSWHSGPDIQSWYSGPDIQVLFFRSWFRTCYSRSDSQVLILKSWYWGPDIQVLIFRSLLFRSWFRTCSSRSDSQVLLLRYWYVGHDILVPIFRSCYRGSELGPVVQDKISDPQNQALKLSYVMIFSVAFTWTHTCFCDIQDFSSLKNKLTV